MGLLEILDGTSYEELTLMRDGRKASGLAFLQGPGNRRRGVRFDATGGRRVSNNALFGRRGFDSGSPSRRRSDSSPVVEERSTEESV